MRYDFADLVDTDQLQSLLEGFTNVVGTVTAILDVNGEVLVATGWHEICTRFHRVQPETRARCVQSDTELAGQMKAGEKYTLYQCRNGLVDAATPIFVEGAHVGNVFTGQFFFEPPDVEFFRKQAAEFGFDETAYLDALSKVPIRTHDQIVGTMDFLSSVVELVGTMGLAKKKLLAANAELAIRNRIAQVFLTIANDDTYPEVLRILLEAVESKQGVFGYLDESGALVCPAMIGDMFNRCPFIDGEHLLPRESWEDVLCCRAMVEKKAFYSNEPSWLTSDGQVSVERYVCLPIVYHEKAIGLLFVADKATDYDEDDVRLLETIAARIAPILHARLEGDRQEEGRKIAERERSRLIAILEATSDLVSTATPEGRLTYMNRAGRAMLGWSGNEDVRLHRIPELHHRPAAESALQEAIPTAEREGIWIGETLLLRRDGAEVPVSQVVMAHRSEDGRLEYLSTIMRDISEQRRAELEREEMIARLESQNAELERFVYTVSHDLKTPLITMEGYLGILKEDLAREDHEKIEEDLGRMGNATRVMARLLGDVLEMSRIGRVVRPPGDVPLGEMAREAVELVAGPIALRGVQVDIQPDLPTVFGDRQRLLELLQNLIENAVKYMGDQPQPRIEIGVDERDGQRVCHVRDNGVGIDAPYHEKVFDLFEQLDPNVEGSGIGLALVRRIVEVHGGRVWVESEGAGRGSTFCFTLPEKTEQ